MTQAPPRSVTPTSSIREIEEKKTPEKAAQRQQYRRVNITDVENMFGRAGLESMRKVLGDEEFNRQLEAAKPNKKAQDKKSELFMEISHDSMKGNTLADVALPSIPPKTEIIEDDASGSECSYVENEREGPAEQAFSDDHWTDPTFNHFLTLIINDTDFQILAWFFIEISGTV